MDIYGFYKGEAFSAYEYLGAHVTGDTTIFRTYAPNASGVSLIGDFSDWEPIPMERVVDGRFFELACPEAKEGMRYKYRIFDREGSFIDHCDPYGY
ncbi:MAG TPA: glycogen-branching enzyme, partial [Ruminococcus sp.]|nr:glycogen-branching enzyme [Ruminococcus sp.]